MKEEEIKIKYSKNLYALRKSKSLSQAQLAEALNYTHKAVSKWENKETMPDIVTLSSIAEYFDITVDDLINSHDAVKKSQKKRDRRRITLSSVGICFFLTAVIYLVLLVTNVPKSYISIPFAFLTSGIVYVVFASLWFKKYHVFIATSIIVWSTAIILMLFMDFAYWWLVLIIAFITDLAFYPFFRIFFNNGKEKSTSTN